MLEGGGVRLDRVGPTGEVDRARLVDRRDVHEEEHAARIRRPREDLDGELDLVLDRSWIGHAERSIEVALVEERGEDAPERRRGVEEAGAPDAHGVIAARSKARDDVRRVEDERRVAGRLAALEARR